MQAAVIYGYGGPGVLRFEDYPDWRPVAFPGVLGWDLSETIIALGESACRGRLQIPILKMLPLTQARSCDVEKEKRGKNTAEAVI